MITKQIRRTHRSHLKQELINRVALEDYKDFVILNFHTIGGVKYLNGATRTSGNFCQMHGIRLSIQMINKKKIEEHGMRYGGYDYEDINDLECELSDFNYYINLDIEHNKKYYHYRSLLDSNEEKFAIDLLKYDRGDERHRTTHSVLCNNNQSGLDDNSYLLYFISPQKYEYSIKIPKANILKLINYT
jgi:hypothetical protein